MARVDENTCSTGTRTRARQFYEAYTANSGNLNYRGEQCPAWDALTTEVRSNWCAVVLRADVAEFLDG